MSITNDLFKHGGARLSELGHLVGACAFYTDPRTILNTKSVADELRRIANGINNECTAKKLTSLMKDLQK